MSKASEVLALLSEATKQELRVAAKDVATNFKKITKVDPEDMFDDEGMDQDMVSKTLPAIEKYVKKKFGITDLRRRHEDFLYYLDDFLIHR